MAKRDGLSLTKAQKRRVFDCRVGYGIAAYKADDDAIVSFEFFIDSIGRFRYIGNGKPVALGIQYDSDGVEERVIEVTTTALDSCLVVKQGLADENIELQEGIKNTSGLYLASLDAMLAMAYDVGQWVYAKGEKGRIDARHASSAGVTYDIEFINENGIVWGADTYAHADCKPFDFELDNDLSDAQANVSELRHGMESMDKTIGSLNQDISRLRRELEEAQTALSNEMRMRASVEHRAEHMAKLLKEEGDFSHDRLRKLRLANQWSMAWKKAARDYRERYQIALESLEAEREWRDSYQKNGENYD